MAKPKRECFVVEFPLKVEKWQKDVLNKRLTVAATIYNQCVAKTQGMFREMSKTKCYRAIEAELAESRPKKPEPNRKKTPREVELYKQLGDIRKEHGFTEYDFMTLAAQVGEPYKHLIDSTARQKIGSRLWTAWSRFFFGDGEAVRFKKRENYNSVEGKSNKAGIRFKDGKIEWMGLSVPVVIEKDNPFEQMSFDHDISYCRIIRRWVRGQAKFYVQIVFKGFVPPKIDKRTGEFKHGTGQGRVGLDIGTQTLAVASGTKVALVELADRVNDINAKKRCIERYMDRSRRAVNPSNYNPDGTPKKGALRWVKSNRYKKAQLELREMRRKEAAVRRYQHHCLANEIIALGDEYVVESMSFKGLQRKAKKTEVSEKTGRNKRKKRFGKSIGNKAPALFVELLEQKAHGKLLRVATGSFKASQYDHIGDCYVKKKLGQRWAHVGKHRVQRDLYSAFLLMNADSSLMTADTKLCNETFNNFLILHDQAIARLEKMKSLPSSMGIKVA